MNAHQRRVAQRANGAAYQDHLRAVCQATERLISFYKQNPPNVAFDLGTSSPPVLTLDPRLQKFAREVY